MSTGLVAHYTSDVLTALITLASDNSSSKVRAKNHCIVVKLGLFQQGVSAVICRSYYLIHVELMWDSSMKII